MLKYILNLYVCLQRFKRKPGRADNERSLGDASERVHKRLRTVESAEQREQEHTPDDAQQESDMYEHIRHGEEKYDAQTYGEPCTSLNTNSMFRSEFHSIYHSNVSITKVNSTFIQYSASWMCVLRVCI